MANLFKAFLGLFVLLFAGTSSAQGRVDCSTVDWSAFTDSSAACSFAVTTKCAGPPGCPAGVTYAASARYVRDEHFTVSAITLADDTAWTVSVWVDLLSAGEANTNGLWGNTFAGANLDRGQVATGSTIYVYDAAGNSVNWVVGSILGAWTHLVFVADGTDANNLVLYINDVSAGARTLADSGQTVKMIAGLGSATQYSLDGEMASFGIWDGRALTVPDVAALFAAGPDLLYVALSGAQKVSLAPWWDFEEALGAQRNDSHGASHLADVNTVDQVEVIYP